MPASEHTYAHDEPWRPGEVERLGRRGFAKRIAHTIGSRSDRAGLVVALYGAWGEGKTSVLRMVREDLTRFDDIVAIEFNPWRFRDADHLVEMFFDTLADRLGDAVQLRTQGEAIGAALRRYSKVLKGLPVFGDAASGTAEAVGERIGEPALEDLRQRVESGICESGVRPVVFIDDIDRLDADEIRAVVRLVKLTAGFENTTYVLAFDPEIVAGALATSVGGAVPADGRRYLEKIVQVPLQLPAADQSTLFFLMLEHLNDAIREVDVAFPEGDQRAFVRYVEPLFSARRRTVREGKRYANAAGFALPLLAGEVHVGDLLLLEALRAWYPEVHARLQEHRELFVADGLGRPPSRQDGGMHPDTAQNALAVVLSGLGQKDARAVTDALEHLFPFVLAVTRNTHHGPEWVVTWDRSQQAASHNYFDRYFQYAVPRTDVSDHMITRIAAALSTGDSNGAAALLRIEAATAAANRLVDKLSARAEALAPRAANALARALAATGDLYRDDPNEFLGGFVSPEASAARVIRRCLMRLPYGERVPLALEVVEGTPSLRFATACYRWIRALGTERSDGTAPLTEADEAHVKETLGVRLDTQHQQCVLYRWDPAEERRTLLDWWGICTGADYTRSNLASRFAAEPRDAAEFLLPFKSHGWGMESGLRTPDRMAENDYDAACRLADAEVVMTALGRIYGDDIGTFDEYNPPSFTTDEEAVAHQFARHHRIAQSRAGRDSARGEHNDGVGDGELPSESLVE